MTISLVAHSIRAMLIEFSAVLTSYLLGSISSAILVARLLRLPDPRTEGSLNPGATNMLRLGGKGAALATLLGDMIKGIAPVLVARTLDASDALLGAVAVGAFLGHLYPLYFGLRGGKGVATLFGTLLGLDALVGGMVLTTWLLVALVFRYSSLAALTASALAPVYLGFLQPRPAIIGAVCGMVLLLFWRHRSNIRKLLDRTEGKLGEKRS